MREPVSYIREVSVRGYLRRDGRQVKGYIRRVWVVAFPVDSSTLDLKDFGREPYMKGLFVKEKAAPPRPAVKGKQKRRETWISVKQRMREIYSEYDFFELEDEVYRKDADSDVVSRLDGLVWDKPIAKRDFKVLGILEAAVVRCWVLLYNTARDVYFVFARARSLIPFSKEGYQSTVYSEEDVVRLADNRRSFVGVYQEAKSIYDEVLEWAENETDYIEVRELLAWTFWYVPRKSPDMREIAPITR